MSAPGSCCRQWGWPRRRPASVTRDLARAASLYQQACDGGAVEGCFNLGVMYDAGEGGLVENFFQEVQGEGGEGSPSATTTVPGVDEAEGVGC